LKVALARFNILVNRDIYITRYLVRSIWLVLYIHLSVVQSVHCCALSKYGLSTYGIL